MMKLKSEWAGNVWTWFSKGLHIGYPGVGSFVGDGFGNYQQYFIFDQKIPRAMIIDDDPYMIRLMENILERLGIRALSYSSPVEALRALQYEPVSILFVDQRMSEMTGEELVFQAERECRYRHRPRVVFITGDPQQVRMEKGDLHNLEYGSIIPKNLAPIELFNRFATEVKTMPV